MVLICTDLYDIGPARMYVVIRVMRSLDHFDKLVMKYKVCFSSPVELSDFLYCICGNFCFENPCFSSCESPVVKFLKRAASKMVIIIKGVAGKCPKPCHMYPSSPIYLLN